MVCVLPILTGQHFDVTGRLGGVVVKSSCHVKVLTRKNQYISTVGIGITIVQYDSVVHILVRLTRPPAL